METTVLKRITALALCVLTLLTAFVGCADEETPENSGTTAAGDVSEKATEPEETEYRPNVPDVKYDGYEMTVLQRAKKLQYYGEVFIDAETISGDLITDSVYKRNRQLEEKFGIKIVAEECGDKNEIVVKYENSVNNGEERYSMLIGHTANMGAIAVKGLYANIANMPYANFDATYWAKNSLRGLEIQGKNFMFMNDISYTALHYTRGVVFNTYLVNEYKTDNPYALVKSNAWTLENFYKMASSVSDDINGDLKYDSNDRFGMTYEPGIATFLLVGAGVTQSDLDENGNRYLRILDDTTLFDKTVEVFDQYNAFISDSAHAISFADAQATAQYAGGQYVGARKLFAEDHYLFIIAGAYSFDELAGFGMTHEYGIVPLPKYSSDQETYYTKHDISANIFAIPAYQAKDLERLSAIIEYWAYLSEQIVKPQYYDLHVKTKRAYGTEFGEMMDILKSAVDYEYAEAFSLGITTVLTEAQTSGVPASYLTSALKPLKKKLIAFNEDFLAIN